MSSIPTSRIWESPNKDVAPNHDPRPAQLPSIATLTSNLPIQSNAVVHSPTYPPSSNRDSDPWPSQPQSTRESTNLPLSIRVQYSDIGMVKLATCL